MTIPYIDTPLSQREADGIRGMAEHIDRQAMELRLAKSLLRELLELCDDYSDLELRSRARAFLAQGETQ